MHGTMRYRVYTLIVFGGLLVFASADASVWSFSHINQGQSLIRTKSVAPVHTSWRRNRKARSLPVWSPNVSLKASLFANGPLVSQDVVWRVYEEGTKEKDPIWSGPGAPRLRLLPGNYRIEAKYGLARASQVIEVRKDAQTDAMLVLNAGTLRVKGVAVDGGEILSDISFNLRGSEPDLRELNLAGRTEAVFHVPAGSYHLLARRGFAHIDIPVTIEAGKDVSTVVVTNTAALSLSAKVARGSAPISDVTFTIYEDSDAPQRHEVARSTLSAPRLILPAGAYRVAITAGGVRDERRVVLNSGEEKSEAFTLSVGGVRLSAVSVGKQQLSEKALQYRFFSLSDEKSLHQPLFSTRGTSSTVLLKKGRYRIEGQYGWHNVRQVREVDVPAGSTVNVNFEFNVCDITLKLLSKSGSPMTDVKWTLKYPDGGTVLISQDAAPRLILQAGNYQAMALHQTKAFSRSFVAVAGSGQTIELIAD